MSRILMVAAEMAPFAKVGGLGDAVYALSMALAAAGHDVRVVLPCYGSIDRKAFGLRPAASLEVPMGVLGRIAVTVLQGDGAMMPFDPADVIYVSAGATRPVDAWLDALKEGGRLVIPLTTNAAFGSGPPRGPQGAMFRIERRGDEFRVSVVSGAAFIPGEGLRDPVSEAALAAGFARGGVESVTRLYRTDDLPEEQCWIRAPGWSLAYR